MTQKWTVPSDLFAGQTVAILGTGPSMNQALAESVKGLPCIATRRSVRLAPWAKMLVAIDPVGEVWEETRDFEGLRITGSEAANLDALYLPMRHETVTLAEGNVVEFRNNGLAMMRIAAAGGAAKILLLGMDTDGYGLTPEGTPGLGHDGLTIALNALIAELRGRGIEVERMGERSDAA